MTGQNRQLTGKSGRLRAARLEPVEALRNE